MNFIFQNCKTHFLFQISLWLKFVTEDSFLKSEIENEMLKRNREMLIRVRFHKVSCLYFYFVRFYLLKRKKKSLEAKEKGNAFVFQTVKLVSMTSL